MDGRVYRPGRERRQGLGRGDGAAFLAFREADLPLHPRPGPGRGRGDAGRGHRGACSPSWRGAGRRRRRRWSASPPGSTSRWRRRGCWCWSWWRAARPATPRTPRGSAPPTPRGAWPATWWRSRRSTSGRRIPRWGRRPSSRRMVRAGDGEQRRAGEAAAILDVRTTPALDRAARWWRASAARSQGEVRVLSDRLRAAGDAGGLAAVLAAPARARPGRALYGSATLSDLALLDGVPAIKCGPGESERSHTPDEFVLEEEVLDGARFYARAGPQACAERRNLMARLWEPAEGTDRRRAARRAGARATPPARTTCSTSGWCPTTSRPRSPTPRCSPSRGCSRPRTWRRSARGLEALAAEHAARRVADRARRRGRAHRARDAASRRASARPARASTSAARATTRCSPRCASTCATRSRGLAAGARAVAAALDAVAAREARDAAPRLHPPAARPCRARSRCGRGGFAAELRDDAEGSRPRCAAPTRTRSARPPATACRSCPSTARRRAKAWASPRVHEPVTAVQLSRGKAEAQLALRDRPADAGPRAARRRPRALLHAGVRLRHACPRR